MGVESDRLVSVYLSRVGDLAQTVLPAAQRMQLIAQLRNDIERERRTADSEAAVRRILGRIGSPDEVVEAASGTSTGSHGTSSTGSHGTSGSYGTSGGRAAPPPAQEPPPGSYGPSAKRGGGPQVPKARPDDGGTPRAAGAGAARDGEPDWWRVDARGGGRGGAPRAGDEIAGLTGMTGGVFIPFDDEELAGFDDDDGPLGPGRGGNVRRVVVEPAEEEPAPAEEAAEARPRRRVLPRLRKGGGGEGRRGLGSPVLLLAAALLIAGAALGSLIPLGLGWLTGYLSRKLSRPQAKFAVLGIPGTVAAGMLVWIWGRDVGKWGTPIAQGQLGQAFKDAYPPTIRVAAVATALYLLWRSRRTA